jgi:hypothetical protein
MLKKYIKFKEKIMKTFTKLFIVGALCASSLQASSITYGITSADFAKNGSNAGFSFGIQKLFYKPQKLNGFGIGAIIGSDYFTLDKISGLDDDMGLLINTDLLLGYSYKKVTLLVGLGYGLGQVGSETFKGRNYLGALEYNFTDKHGIGIKYKNNAVDLTIGGKSDDLEITSIYYKATY